MSKTIWVLLAGFAYDVPEILGVYETMDIIRDEYAEVNWFQCDTHYEAHFPDESFVRAQEFSVTR